MADRFYRSADGGDPITIRLSRRDAERLSYGLSDLLCWHSGFAAAREGLDLDHSPMGVGAARDLNLKIKGALDRADEE